MSATVKVFEVCYHVADNHALSHGGACGDGSFTFRTRDERKANQFAETHAYYGKKSEVHVAMVPRKLASRWGV